MFHIGIDLGTTNCGFSWAQGEEPVHQFDIPQLVGPGETHAEPLLESALYLPQNDSFAEGADYIVGRFAARRGAETLGRLVTSAKSWLCYTAADRTAPILPLNAQEGARRVSPVEASQRYLEHLRDAWNEAHPKAPFSKQQVVLTVPASFDAVARELTQKAAAKAGYKNLILLEEPQAAFYAWIERHDDWRQRVKPGDLVLVVDVGGGTTDFTLIAVRGKDGALDLERVAVGEHLLLGGDNMDLALAHAAAARMPKLDRLQFQSLWQQARLAKERLLSDPSRAEEPLSVLGRGSSLIGGTIKGKLTREEVETLLVDGFFPRVAMGDVTARRARAGVVEVGLPYEPEPAITRHLAAFLKQGRPTHVLFNGGVFRAAHLRERVLEVLRSWFGSIEALEGEDLMHAVARGAAYYGRARAGRGVRIRGGISRTYYVGIESAMPAVPGMRVPMKALTLAPFGTEEGSDIHVPSGEFGVYVGEPAEFRFFASAVRKNDAPGTLLDEVTDELEELAPIQVTLPAEKDAPRVVRVRFEAVVTETGVLELWCVAADARKWKLEFQVRR